MLKNKKKFKVFIAGVMQGSRRDGKIFSQRYRSEITRILTRWNNNLEVVDPDKTDPDRLFYNKRQAGKMFFDYCNYVRKVDLIVSFLPKASMGTAIEMWEAYHARVPIISISPMKTNWVIKLLSNKVYGRIKDFRKDLENGQSELNKMFGRS
jgi:hypothetical protein